MKKLRYLVVILIILTLMGCNNKQKINESDENLQENKYNIAIKEPIVLSKNSVVMKDDKTIYVNIEMISGQYTYDEFPGASMGHNWNGQYQVRVYTDEFDFTSTLYTAPVFIFENQPMNFRSEFSLIFDDYNDDGNPDFTLGQYAGSNGYDYALFSINQAGEVKRLDTGGIMFISEGDYSIKLEKLSPTSFRKSAYDNSIGETVEILYQWNDNKFEY